MQSTSASSSDPNAQKLLGHDHTPKGLDDFKHLVRHLNIHNTEAVQGQKNKYAIISIEDNESDDAFSSLIAAKHGLLPDLVLTVGGQPFVREAATAKFYEALADKTDKPAPEVFVGAELDETKPYDETEGEGYIPLEDSAESPGLATLRVKGQDKDAVAKRIDAGHAALIELYKEYDSVLIMLKTAATPVHNMFIYHPEWESKTTLVWSAALAWFEEGSKITWAPAFNIRRDAEAAKWLFESSMTKIVVGGGVSKSKMMVLADAELVKKQQDSAAANGDTALVELFDKWIPGIEGLSGWFKSGDPIAEIIGNIADNFNKKQFDKWRAEEKDLIAKGDKTKLKKKLSLFEQVRIFDQDPNDRVLVITDNYVNVVLPKVLDSVHGVVRAEVKLEGSDPVVDYQPAGSTYLVTDMDFAGPGSIVEAMQEVIGATGVSAEE